MTAWPPTRSRHASKWHTIIAAVVDPSVRRRLRLVLVGPKISNDRLSFDRQHPPIQIAQAEHGQLSPASARVRRQPDEELGLLGDEQCLAQLAVPGLPASSSAATTTWLAAVGEQGGHLVREEMLAGKRLGGARITSSGFDRSTPRVAAHERA